MINKKIFAVAGLLAGIAPLAALAQVSSLSDQTTTAPAAIPAYLSEAPLSIPDCYNFSRNLKPGMGNDPASKADVLNLQQALIREGYFNVDTELGIFGKNTTDAVKAFQEKYRDEVLTPVGLTKGTGFVGAVTRLKLQALYGCSAPYMVARAAAAQYANAQQAAQTMQQKTMPAIPNLTSVKLAITSITLDNTGVTATFCNQGAIDLPTAPFRIRLNGINRDFEVAGAQKANTCYTNTFPYSSWGLTYDPATSNYSAIGIIDPFGFYKTAKIQAPLTATSTLAVPAILGPHLSVRSVVLLSSGLQATFCNLGTLDLTTFPVRITMNGVAKTMDLANSSNVYAAGKCQNVKWTYDTWGLAYNQGSTYAVNVVVDPDNIIKETNEFDNSAALIATP